MVTPRRVNGSAPMSAEYAVALRPGYEDLHLECRQGGHVLWSW
ncbi:hypothetical protein OH786_17815 [Streptomyces atratus]